MASETIYTRNMFSLSLTEFGKAYNIIIPGIHSGTSLIRTLVNHPINRSVSLTVVLY